MYAKEGIFQVCDGANVYRVYHQGFKPTASDVGALPISGGTLTGDLVIQSLSSASGKLVVPNAENNVGIYWGNNTQWSRMYAKEGILQVCDGAGVYRVYHQNFKPTASDVGALSTSGGVVNGMLTIGGGASVGGSLSVTSGDLYVQNSGEGGQINLVETTSGKQGYLDMDAATNRVRIFHSMSGTLRVWSFDGNGNFYSDGGVAAAGDVVGGTSVRTDGWVYQQNKGACAQFYGISTDQGGSLSNWTLSASSGFVGVENNGVITRYSQDTMANWIKSKVTTYTAPASPVTKNTVWRGDLDTGDVNIGTWNQYDEIWIVSSGDGDAQFAIDKLTRSEWNALANACAYGGSDRMSIVGSCGRMWCISPMYFGQGSTFVHIVNNCRLREIILVKYW